MSSALASARKRSIPQPGQQPPLPGKTIGSAPANGGNAPNGNPSTSPGQLTLAQIIDVYGRRILQLEKQVSEVNIDTVSTSTGGVNPASLAKLVSEIVDSKLAAESFDSKIEARLKDFALKDIVPIVEELNARNEVLAREIVELKDLLLNLQSFTMTTHKKILDIALEPFEAIGQMGTIQGDNILDDIQEGVEENEVGEEDEEHTAILAELEKSLLSIPEEYELNPGTSEAKGEAKGIAKGLAKDVSEHIKTLAKSIEETTLETVPEETDVASLQKGFQGVHVDV